MTSFQNIPAAHQRTPSGKPRLRGLGILLNGSPGPDNAITDVPGLAVGYTTLIQGDGPLEVGRGPVRTGVTAVLPRGLENSWRPVMAGYFSLNGSGEMTGCHWIEESGTFTGPVLLTNTHSCGLARDAAIRWLYDKYGDRINNWQLPVSAETYDGDLNDINGFHVTADHVLKAITGACSGPIELGSVGGGTGMITYDFKGGSGSASRLVETGGRSYTLGIFVQSNFGHRHELVVDGVRIGKHIKGHEVRSVGRGSIIGLAATDAPLLPHQLKRIARRMPLGIARTGSISHNTSGDIFLTFSTANEEPVTGATQVLSADYLPNQSLNPLFQATVEATEEAVIDSMIANETMTGRDGVTAIALPHDRLLKFLSQPVQS